MIDRCRGGQRGFDRCHGGQCGFGQQAAEITAINAASEKGFCDCLGYCQLERVDRFICIIKR